VPHKPAAGYRIRGGGFEGAAHPQSTGLRSVQQDKTNWSAIAIGRLCTRRPSHRCDVTIPQSNGI